MVAFLLGQLRDATAAELESAFFADEELFATLCSIETELIHAFLRGELTGPRLQCFEDVYAGDTPRGRRLAAEREWFAAAKLADRAGRTGGVAPRAWFLSRGQTLTYVMASLFLIAAVVLGWEVRRVTGIEAALRSVRADLSARSAAPQFVASFLLRPGVTRGDSAPKRIMLPADTAQVRFELALESPARQEAYNAVLRVVGGYEVWSGRAIREGSVVNATVPARALQRNDYKLTLEPLGPNISSETAPSYVFSVVGQ